MAHTVLIVLLSTGILSAMQEGSIPEIEVQGETLVISHNGCSLSVSLQSPSLRIQGQEVPIGPATATETSGDLLAGEELVLHYASIKVAEGTEITTVLYLVWSPEEGVLRKWAEISLTGGDTSFVLEEVVFDVLSKDALIEEPRFSVPRSFPVFLSGFFAGIEFPVASTRIEEGQLLLGHAPLATLEARTTYRSKTAVYGIAAPGHEREAFHQYIEYHRPAPKGLHINYNSWWTSPVPFSEADILGLMSIFEERLYKPYGVALDSFTIDMGWSNPKSIWEINATLFPQGFSHIQAAAERMGARLGLWTSPSSFYAPALDPDWAEAQGYKTISLPVAWSAGGVRLLSLGDKRYSTHYRDMLVDMTTRFGVRQIKLDGLFQGYDSMAGPFSAEATVEGAVAAFEAVRKAVPDVWLECTFDANASPWWLFYVNSVIGGFGDDSPYGRVPCPVYRESYTTARDYYNLQASDRLTSPIAAQEILGIIHQSNEPFLNDAVMTILRGHAFLPLYVNPKYMNDTRWRMLADMLRWARNNEETLVQRPTKPLRPEAWLQEGTPWFSHDAPMPRTPYGYAHQTANGALVALRNPWVAPQSYTLNLADMVEDSTDIVHLVSLYPEPRVYGEAVEENASVEVALAPYETVVLCINSESSITDLPKAADCIGNKIQVSECKSESIQVVFDEKEIAMGPNWTDVTGETTGIVEVKTAAQLTIHAPQARLLALVECNAEGLYAQGSLIVNGVATDLKAIRSGQGFAASSVPAEEHWVFLEAPLNSGENDIELNVQTGSDLSDISVWVWATRENSEANNYPNALPSPELISLDAAALLPPGKYRDGMSQETRPRQVVRIDGIYLDALEPTLASQGWGTLQKNRSIWEKPLTIGDNRYQRGLGVHAPSEVVYALNGAYKTFEAYAGVDGANNGTVTFEVQVDGQTKWTAGLMTRSNPSQLVQVDIAGASTLRLLVGDGGDNVNGDHANWADAKLLR